MGRFFSLLGKIKSLIKQYWKFILIVIAMIIIDQGAKIAVELFFEYDKEALKQVKDTIHIHPYVNYEDPNRYNYYAEITGISVYVWKWVVTFRYCLAGCISGMVTYFCYRITCYANLNPRKKLVGAILVIVWAATLCGTLDRVFWDGTHDFLCISRGYIENGKARIIHISSDIKDWYLTAWLVLFLVHLILFLVDINKFSKDKNKWSSFVQSVKDKIKSKFTKKKYVEKENE